MRMHSQRWLPKLISFIFMIESTQCRPDKIRKTFQSQFRILFFFPAFCLSKNFEYMVGTKPRKTETWEGLYILSVHGK